MEIDKLIYEEALEVLQTKIHNTYAYIAFQEEHNHYTPWYQYGMLHGLEMGLVILQDLQYNKVYPLFKEKEKTLKDWEKELEELINDES